LRAESKYSEAENANSIQTNADTADIMSTLLKPFQGRVPAGEDLLMLKGDARLIVIAGRWALNPITGNNATKLTPQ
jgi:hypothetical protein